MSVQACSFIVCAILFALCSCVSFSDGSCASLNRCCQGTNSTCKYQNGNGKRYTRACFCDEYCQKSGDCCEDYKEHCLERAHMRSITKLLRSLSGSSTSMLSISHWKNQWRLHHPKHDLVHDVYGEKFDTFEHTTARAAQNCVMTYWSPWSYCSARCGKGVRERRRRVHVTPSNGGKLCGALSQTRGCYHNDRRCRSTEIAQLLPSYLNRQRNEDDKFGRPSVMKMMEKRRESYCVNYRISSIAWYCRYFSPYHVLTIGSAVCVECHDTAMNRRGRCQGATLGERSRWRAMTSHACYGSWESRGEMIEDCVCGERPGKDFVFV